MSTVDATAILVRLHELRQVEPYRAASRWLQHELAASSWAEIDVRHPPGSPGREALRTVLEHWELVGTLADAGAIDPAILFDSTGEHLGVWSKVQPWIESARAALADPTLFENLELLIQRHAEWARQHPPKLARRAETLR